MIIANLGLFVLNFFVPARFKWADELPRLSLINRRIFQVHAVFIAFILLLSGLLLVLLPHELIQPTLAVVAFIPLLAAALASRLPNSEPAHVEPKVDPLP